MSERLELVCSYYKMQLNKKYDHEADFLKIATEFCELLGEECVIIREAAATRNGVADLVLCYNGRFIACELKRERGVPTQQQLKFISKVRVAGGLAAVCTCLQGIVDLLMQTAQ